MLIFSISTGVSMNLCRRWPQNIGKLHQTKLLSPLNWRHSFKTSFWSQSRWPRRKNHVNLAFQPDQFALSRLGKPLCFTIAVSGVSMAGAAIWQYENIRSQATSSNWFKNWNTPKNGQFRQDVNSWWNSLSPGDKVFYPICAINVLVFLAWRVPALQPVMMLYFSSGLTSSALCWPMLFSVFSHYNLFHLAANMFALHSFSEKAVMGLGKEQFLGLYLTAGMISSFTSYFYKAIIRSSTSSLGASGAVMGILGYVCSKYPNSRLSIILLPQFPFEAETGLRAIMGFDFVGCLMRWKFIDHAAHLGGSGFGVIWCHWGQDYIWKKREPLVSAWHKLRGPVR